MKLLIDIGNCRVKWAILDDSGLSASQSFERKNTGLKVQFNKIWKSLKDVDAIWVSNVAGDKIASQFTEWAEKTWQITPNFVQSEAKRFGVSNAYDKPETLGIDRWLGLVAVRQHLQKACCIIDCGTAITVDILTANGQHQGGFILPGLGLMRTTLAAGTDALTEKTDDVAFNLLATNTYSAIQAGTLYSITATLENLIRDLQQNFDNNIRFVISGGDASEIEALLPDDVEIDADIVLKGLKLYAKQPPANSNS
ncbi:MAG TPA: type III pantothenate kinase [Methylophaga sp.]|nr:type III pantothenate kinase [Methylophaga sp.]